MEEDAKRWLYWGIPIVVVIGLGAALYYGRTHKKAEVEQTVQAPAAPASEAPPVRNPIEDPAPSEPLPNLAESDASVQESLTGVFGRSLEPFLVNQNIVRHFVVTVDNLPRKKTAVNLWPVKPMSGELAINGAEDITLSDANYARYTPLIKIAMNADSRQLASMYRRYYPLFQEAYVDLGYPEGYFNDRLVEVIDHLLATPDVQGPIRLTQPGVFYQYADPSLEERSAGQKMLIRMGPQNAASVKAKLRELRKEVAKNPQG
jgi:hypothetical protein